MNWSHPPSLMPLSSNGTNRRHVRAAQDRCSGLLSPRCFIVCTLEDPSWCGMLPPQFACHRLYRHISSPALRFYPDLLSRCLSLSTPDIRHFIGEKSHFGSDRPPKLVCHIRKAWKPVQRFCADTTFTAFTKALLRAMPGYLNLETQSQSDTCTDGVGM